MGQFCDIYGKLNVTVLKKKSSILAWIHSFVMFKNLHHRHPLFFLTIQGNFDHVAEIQQKFNTWINIIARKLLIPGKNSPSAQISILFIIRSKFKSGGGAVG